MVAVIFLGDKCACTASKNPMAPEWLPMGIHSNEDTKTAFLVFVVMVLLRESIGGAKPRFIGARHLEAQP